MLSENRGSSSRDGPLIKRAPVGAGALSSTSNGSINRSDEFSNSGNTRPAQRGGFSDDVIERARAVNIGWLVRQRGLRLRGRNNLKGPCPHDQGDDRLWVNLRQQSFGCRGCGVAGHGAISFVRFIDGVSFREAVELLVGDTSQGKKAATSGKSGGGSKFSNHPDSYERQQHRKASWLWTQRQTITGTVAERYLREVRGITIALPATIGFLPPRDGYPPTIIAAYALPNEIEPGVLGEPQNVDAVHLTRLLPDGSDRQRSKGSRITIGRPLGRPIVIAPLNDLLGLGVTEGIEDALTVHQGTGLGAWAAGTAPFMPHLIRTVETLATAFEYDASPEAVTIYAHADRDGQGQRGARGLAKALLARGGIDVGIEGLS